MDVSCDYEDCGEVARSGLRDRNGMRACEMHFLDPIADIGPARPYDTGRDPLNAALDALQSWFRDKLVDEDGVELGDSDAYELLMIVADNVLDASDRPIRKRNSEWTRRSRSTW